ncbi:methylenetetrahydrofolate reductase C-terminal domain-containing protein [Luminiphilus sp. nBUS_16]|uniref:methylenetetrahydrofolate reductase C-terminal domain-containing protein n=1 Tax=Luminiphilus sp. nBUS_16 TaxID=3395315 RepID=UPI003EBD6954
MKAARDWSVRHAKGLHKLYEVLAWTLHLFDPVLRRIGYERLDKPFARVEGLIKGFLFDSQSCGQCTLGSTGMACPMNCPKTLRNGPCGGVRQNGGCEIKPEMTCVWVKAWEGSQQMGEAENGLQVIQLPVDTRLKGHSSWLEALKARRETSA